MKLLFEQNLLRRLVGRLDSEFPGSRHVVDDGLETAADCEIWDHAAAHGYIIVSKDSDFRQLAFLHGPPPKAIWDPGRQRVGSDHLGAVAASSRTH